MGDGFRTQNIRAPVAMKDALMIAYHFPPLAGSSGIQRTLRFAQQLPALGWRPSVLSVHRRAYEHTSDDLDADIPPGTVVRRAFALDAARHLSVAGRHLGAMARPDRWASWRFDGIRQGLRMIDELRPSVLWSTFPIASAHLIGAELQRRSGLPWIADFRDPMAQHGYPADQKTWQSYKAVEELAVHQARYCVFTAPSAARLYRERYPFASDRMVVLENGYDEESFAGLDGYREPLNPGCMTLLHSGIVYPDERDPRALFAALDHLQRTGLVSSRNFRMRFRAAVHEDTLRSLAAEFHVEPLIEICPAIGYRQALAEMLRADGLVVMQAANCSFQIPAKLYEYLRAGRPIVAMTDPGGDTAGVLRNAGLDSIVPLDSADAIAALLPQFLAQIRAGHAAKPELAVVRRASRRERSETLVQLFNAVTR